MRNPLQRSTSGGSFLPTDYVKGKQEFRANLICLGLFGVVMFGVVGAFFVTNRQWIQVRQMQKAISTDYTKEAEKIEQLKKLDEQNAQMLDKAELTTALVEMVPRSVLLSELVNRMPENMTLLEISLEGKRAQPAKVGGGANAEQPAAVRSLSGKGSSPSTSRVSGRSAPVKARKAEAPKVEAPRFDYTLKVVGVASENNEITDYLKSLQESAILDKVDLRYINATDVDDTPFRKFEIQATLRRGADGRALEPPTQASGAPADAATATAPASTDQTTGQPSAPGAARADAPAEGE